MDSPRQLPRADVESGIIPRVDDAILKVVVNIITHCAPKLAMHHVFVVLPCPRYRIAKDCAILIPKKTMPCSVRACHTIFTASLAALELAIEIPLEVETRGGRVQNHAIGLTSCKVDA